MSREEAIKELTDLLTEEFLSEYAEAIGMGIEALKQQPKIEKAPLSMIKSIREKEDSNGYC